MVAVRSLGSLVTVESNWAPTIRYSSMRMYDRFNQDYATLYRTQPNVRTCVDFLARNIAQLGLHVFRRVSDTDRERLRDHPLAHLLAQPLPAAMKMTRYRMIEGWMSDLGIYWKHLSWKLRPPERPMSLLRVPPPLFTVKGALFPATFEINLGGKVITPAPEEVLYMRGYNPESASDGLSPLETLRRVLAEEHAAGEYREHFWANSARMQGVLQRPKEPKAWSATARERFLADWAALHSGAENSGKTAILEEGMEWKEVSFNAQESEYLLGRKLTREECARAFHIPLPMVGILDHATFSNIKEQHKHLYQDCLGPWLAMLEEDIALQLLPDFEDSKDVYVEFNIAEKLQGSFEEQALALQASVGRPWMTVNQARARQNMPRIEGGDELVTPLNVLVGGQASPRDSAPPAVAPVGEAAVGEPVKALTAGCQQDHSVKAVGSIDPTRPRLRKRHEEKWRQVLNSHFERQRGTVISRIPAKAAPTSIDSVWLDRARWDREMAEDLFALNKLTAAEWAHYLADEMNGDIIEELMYDFLSENARIAAEQINAATREQVKAALEEDDYGSALGNVFALAIGVRAAEIATSKVTGAANFGAHEAARQLGLRQKTWVVNSGNPRSAHAAINGETVAIRDRFSNGMMWPGDPAGGADNNAGCQCSVAFGR